MASTQPPERLALVVDDDPEVLSATALFALREGFSVLTAKDGKAGIDAYRRNGSAVTVTIATSGGGPPAPPGPPPAGGRWPQPATSSRQETSAHWLKGSKVVLSIGYMGFRI